MSGKHDIESLNNNDSKTSGTQDIKKPFNKLSFSLSSSKNVNSTLTAEETPMTDSPLQRQHQKKEVSSALKIKEISTPSSKVPERVSNSEAKDSSDSHSSDSSSIGKPLKPIKLKLMTGNPKVSGVKRPAQEGKKLDLSEVFNEDDQPDEEEMPLEAKMRMRNIGKDTPTASGPNSFNKGKLGFCNQAKMLERQLKEAFEPPEKIKKKF